MHTADTEIASDILGDEEGYTKVDTIEAGTTTPKSKKIYRNSSSFKSLCSKAGFAVAIASFLLGLILGKSDTPGHLLQKLMPKTKETTTGGAVLVTGATGRTGALLYHELKRRGVSDVRAFVRDIEKAKRVLGCVKCDATEGVYVGDITKHKDIERAMADGSITTLAIAVGASPNNSPEEQRQIEFDSVVHSVEALALAHGSRRDHLRVVLCSSMGTNHVDHPSWAGDLPFWKLNAETYLSTSAIPNTVILKPCGLPEGMAGKNSTLVVGHNGTIIDEQRAYRTISREDVASVMAEAATMSTECGKSTNLRFDLCSRPGPVTKDLKGLIDSARWEWDESN